MQRYINEECPVCHSSFAEQDDVVVCPDCGTPHHRECYATLTHCAHADLHGVDFIWKTKTEQMAGQLLAKEQEEIQKLEEQQEEYSTVTFTNMFQGEAQPDNSKFAEKNLDGVSELELTAFLGVRQRYYIELFKAMLQSKRKFSMNLLAGIFAPFHQFYHRMTAFGFVAGGVIFITQLYAFLGNLVLLFPNNTQLVALANSSKVAGVTSMLSYLNFFCILAIAFFNDYFYLRWTLRKIKSIRSRFETEDELYFSTLAKSGQAKFSSMFLYGLLSVFCMGAITLGVISL